MREENRKLGKVELKEAINNVKNILIYKMERKNIKLNIKIENIDLVQDKELLEVLLTNIIDNSIKASNVGSWIDVEGYYGNNEYILKIKITSVPTFNLLFISKEILYMLQISLHMERPSPIPLFFLVLALSTI